MLEHASRKSTNQITLSRVLSRVGKEVIEIIDNHRIPLGLVRLALFCPNFHPSFFLLHHRIVILLQSRINVSPICQARIGVIWTRQIGDDKKQETLSRLTSVSHPLPPHLAQRGSPLPAPILTGSFRSHLSSSNVKCQQLLRILLHFCHIKPHQLSWIARTSSSNLKVRHLAV